MRTNLNGRGFVRGSLDAPKPLGVRPLASVACFYAIGLTAGAFSGAPFWLWAILAGLFSALFVWKRRFAVFLCAVLFIASGYASYRARLPEPLVREDCRVTGVVCSEPAVYEEYASLTLSDVTEDGDPYPHKLRVYISFYGMPMPDIAYGDRVVIESANIRAPKGVTGHGAYDQAVALWRKGIAAIASASVPDVLVEPGPTTFFSVMMRARDWLGDAIDTQYPANAGLARSLLLGDKSQLAEDAYEAFQLAGIVHILAVSGLHVSTLALALTLVLRRLFRMSRKAVYLTMLPFLFLYFALTGFPASILRAAILYALMEAGPLFGRPADRLTGIGAAYLLLALVNPLGAFEAGFLLSFTAVLGMAFICPTFSRAFPLVASRRPKPKRRLGLFLAAKRDAAALRLGAVDGVSVFSSFRLRCAYWIYDHLAGYEGWPRRVLFFAIQMIIMSLAAILGILPVVSRLFGAQTLWALVSNLIAVPVSTLALPLVMLSAALGGIAPVANGIARVADLLLSLLTLLVNRIAAVPWTLEVRLPGMSWPLIAVYAALAIIASMYVPFGRLSEKRAARWKLFFVAGLIGVTVLTRVLAVAPIRGEPGLSITFVDVGQGDGALVNAQGSVYAVDTGKGNAFASRIVASAIDIEAVFLTHPDTDHAGAVGDVLAAGRTDTVYLPECWYRMEIAEEMRSAFEEAQVIFLSAGDTVRLSADVTCEVLHPPKGFVPSDDNEGSLVVLLRYADASALMLGDLPDRAISFPVPDCDVIKLAHHGASSSSGALTLLSASPSAAILSVGPNGYGHPSPEVLDRLERYAIDTYRTDERGDIKVDLLDNGEISVACWLGEGTEDEK